MTMCANEQLSFLHCVAIRHLLAFRLLLVTTGPAAADGFDFVAKTSFLLHGTLRSTGEIGHTIGMMPAE